ncbi:MAG: TetR/AcrR family transcriptional regulator [Sulfuricurvum sp.]|nr:TetR/AcrR family transcriptional regulator [Sulfuricurvum sp.]
MTKPKKISTKERIKSAAIELFNAHDSLSITTNHIAKAAGISAGNLYYHYRNKEEIIREIYAEMSERIESLKSFEKMLSSSNPLNVLDESFDHYGDVFWEYRFLMRDAPVLMALDSELKRAFVINQEKRISQIAGVIKYLISQEILENILKEEIPLRAKLYWFVTAYWQVFTSMDGEVSRESIRETKEAMFKIHIAPFLSARGGEMIEVAGK